MSSTPEPDSELGSAVGTGSIISGAGAAGAIIFLVNSILPENNPLKPILVYLAPTFAILGSSLWQRYQERRRRQILELETRLAYEETRGKINRVLSSPRTTQAQRQQLLDELHELEMEDIRSSAAKARRLIRQRDRSRR